MATLVLEVSDEALEKLAAALADKLQPNESATTTEAEKPQKEEKPDSEAITTNEFQAVIEDAEETSSKKEVLAVLSNFGYRSPKRVKPRDYPEIVDELGKLIDAVEEDDDVEGDDEDAPRTIDEVKDMWAKAKKADDDEAQEVLEEYELKSIRSLKKLDQDDLDDLYEDLADIVEG